MISFFNSSFSFFSSFSFLTFFTSFNKVMNDGTSPPGGGNVGTVVVVIFGNGDVKAYFDDTLDNMSALLSYIGDEVVVLMGIEKRGLGCSMGKYLWLPKS